MWGRVLITILLAGIPTDATSQSDKEQLGLPATEAARQIIYVDASGKSGVAFGRSLRIGRYNPSLVDPFMVQAWSEPLKDCSSHTFNCLKAGNIVLFSPVSLPAKGRSFSYMNRSARVLDCDRAKVCLIEITPLGEADSPPPLVIYFRQSNRGILSLGFEPVLGNSRRASRRFRLVGKIGLFARVTG